MSDDARSPRSLAPVSVERLRAATRDDHRALDHHPELQRLLRPGLTLDGYRRSLLAMRAPQGALEGAVEEGAMRLGRREWLSPRRLPRLEADLAALGVLLPYTAAKPGLTAPRSIAELLGLRYVLEGSRLGAEVIARCLRSSLGDAAPLAFFTAPDGRRHWQRFLQQLADTPLDAPDRLEAAAAARRAFTTYRARLAPSAAYRQEKDSPDAAPLPNKE